MDEFGSFTPPDLYAAPQDVETALRYWTGVESKFWPHRTRAMQDAASELPTCLTPSRS
jgi:hypothetical protein